MKTTHRRFVHAGLGLLLLAMGSREGMSAEAAGTHWVSTWGCGAQLIEPANLPPAPGLADNTLRQAVHATLGGKRLRARFSNAYGTNTITLRSVHAALSAGASAIVPSTDTALSFGGAPSVNIPPGEVVMSDPFNLDLPALSNLSVTIHFGASSGNVTGHPGSRTTSYIQAGDAASAASLPTAAKTAHWYILTGVDVLADSNSLAVVALGDSITDGRGSTTDGNNRWPDELARRLSTNAPTASVAVVNMGIGGNAVLAGGLGPTARTRFERDVLETSGAHWLIVFEGVNDIGGGRGGQAVATNLISAFSKFVDTAHARGMLAYGTTITPFGRSSYYAPGHEAARQTVNNWIRTSGKFDAVIDFDAAARDPATLTNLLAAYDSGDHLHLSPAGYRALANAVNLGLFVP